jgi:hypothetical protein
MNFEDSVKCVLKEYVDDPEKELVSWLRKRVIANYQSLETSSLTRNSLSLAVKKSSSLREALDRVIIQYENTVVKAEKLKEDLESFDKYGSKNPIIYRRC